MKYPLVLLCAVFLATAILSVLPPSQTLQAQQDRLEVLTDKDQYHPGENVYITGYAITPSITWTYTCTQPSNPDCGLAVQVTIYDQTGTVLHSGVTDPAWGSYKAFFHIWQVPCVPASAGSLRIEATMQLAGKDVRGEKTVSLVIPLGGFPPSMGVTTSKSRYFPGETVAISGFLQFEFPAVESRATIVVDVTKGDLSIFEATFTDLPSNSFVLPACYSWQSSYPMYAPAIFFSTAFTVPQDASTGIYTVNAYALDFADAKSFFIVDGSWEYTHTMLALSTAQSSITFVSILWTTSDSTTIPTGATIIAGTQTVILETQTTVTIPEFRDFAAPLVVAAMLALALLLRNPRDRRRTQGALSAPS